MGELTEVISFKSQVVSGEGRVECWIAHRARLAIPVHCITNLMFFFFLNLTKQLCDVNHMSFSQEGFAHGC